ncbi:hypothetical protein ACJX0J_037660, partial [Zea mays]
WVNLLPDFWCVQMALDYPMDYNNSFDNGDEHFVATDLFVKRDQTKILMTYNVMDIILNIDITSGMRKIDDVLNCIRAMAKDFIIPKDLIFSDDRQMIHILKTRIITQNILIDIHRSMWKQKNYCFFYLYLWTIIIIQIHLFININITYVPLLADPDSL